MVRLAYEERMPSVALLNVVLSRSSKQNRGRVWVSVKRVWTCLNMLGLVDSRTIEQMFFSSEDAIRTIGGSYDVT
jgi:hypothetical protein